MGKWSVFKGLEGRYFVDCANRVVQLKKYRYQDIYVDFDEREVYIDDLSKVFFSKEEAEAFSQRLTADFRKKQEQWKKERALEEEAEKARIKALERKPDYLDNLGPSEAKYYLDD